MSIQTLKKKGVITCNGTNVSGKNPGGYWLSQGPFGSSKNVVMGGAGNNGFSLNGGTRNVGYIGKSSAFSKSGTPYYGQFPIGNGGVNGRYPTPQPLFNSPRVRGVTQGRQFEYTKPSVLSTGGMLRKKYRYLYTGQYPNYWVQPVYGNCNLSDNASQWLYIQNKAAANTIVNDTNKPEVYANNYKKGGATGCNTTTARYTAYDIMASRGLYTKTLHIPQTSGQYTVQVQRPCANPTGAQKPFPFAVSSGSGGAGSNGTSNSTTGPPPPILTQTYVSPPDWYIKS
jgi:hypothetical protein